MIRARRSPAWAISALVLASALLVVLVPGVVGQTPAPSVPPGTSSLGSPVVGGTLAATEGRDPDGAPVLRTGTAIDGLALAGERAAYAVGESFAFRLELPSPVGAVRLAIQLNGSLDGVPAIWTYPDLPADPAWDTLAGVLPAPPVGDYVLRIHRGGSVLAQAPLAVRDVPRLTSLVTDPLGLLADSTDRVVAAGQRYEAATGGGWLWTVLISSANGQPVSDWAADLWAVNEDQLDPRDAVLVASVGDIDVSIGVGSEAALTIVPEEIGPIEDEAVFALGDSRWADMVDVVADGLVAAHQNDPQASPSPSPSPTPVPTPQLVRVPDFVGLSRADAEALADRRDVELRLRFRQTADVPRGTILSQDPAAGSQVAPGSTVTVVVAAAPQVVTVPDVSGLDEADAVAILVDAGLRPGTRTERTSESVPAGSIIRTDPRAGIDVAPDTTVDYVVSRGPAATPTPRPTATPRPTPAPVEVPSLRGLDESDAVAVLLDADLQPGDRSEERHENVREGAVIRTDPRAGSLVVRGSAVDYVISLGPPPTTAPETAAPTTPRPTRPPTPAPPRTPRPTAIPGPSLSPVPVEDRLARILEAGVIRVNVSPDDAPWSSLDRDGAPVGFEVAVARQIARRMGVRAEFTTIPLADVSASSWEDRFDIALSHLAITEAQAGSLDFSTPYAYDPGQLAVTAESGLTSADQLAGRAICVASGSLGEAWLNGALALVEPPLPPATPPSGATPFPVATNAECASLITAGGAPFDGWLASGVAIDRAVAAGTPVVPVGDPVYWAPVGIATDPVPGDAATLIERLDAIVAELHADGTLSRQSVRFFDGRDLSAVPGVEPPIEPEASPAT